MLHPRASAALKRSTSSSLCDLPPHLSFYNRQPQRHPRKRRPPDDIAPETPPSELMDEQDEPLPPSKRSRRDVKTRIEKNKTLDFFVIKKTLKQFSRKEAEAIEWDDCLKAVNQAIAEAYLLANFYVLRQLEVSRPVCKIDHVFYQTCLSCVTSKTRMQRSIRQQYDDCVLEQARKEASKRWSGTGLVGNMQDIAVVIPEFSETGFQKWSKKKDVDLENAGYEFMKLRGDRPLVKTEYLNQGWFPAAAKQMATNANNAIIRNFAKRLRSFVMDVFQLTKKETHVTLDGVFAETFEGADSEMVNPVAIDPIIIGLRGQISRTSKNKISWDARDLLPIFYQFLIQIERSNEENKHKEGYREQRTFSLLPTKKGFEATHCKINSTGLRVLLLRSPRVNRELAVQFNGETWTLGASIRADNKSNWTAMADLWWRRLFFVDKIEKAETRSFHREITTDGYAVSVLMSRPTRGEKQKKKETEGEVLDPSKSDVLGPTLSKTPRGRMGDYDVIWGIDPGRTDFITAANQHGKTVRFRSTAYRSASSFYRSNRRSNREIDKVPRIRQLLRATPTKKTASLPTLIEHIEFALEHLGDLLTFFLRPIFRRLKFRRLALKTSQLDRSCDELAGKPGMRTIIGFGDSGTAGSGMIKSLQLDQPRC
ncbi:hypothetical protein BBJ28_00006902 [Nothophytophthora sp. Chile5]|nr:hypothetical protein BBJ28_00006902 [Nothophytophthora sp. Chile5]